VKEVAYRAMQTGDPETVAGLANNVSMGGAPATTPINELTTIQALRSQEAISKARVFELNEKYGAKNPQVIEANQQLQSIQASIQAESGRLAARAKNDLEIATQTESSARRVFQEQKTQAEQLNDKTIQYEIAANEAASSQDLYQGLLKKLKEAGVMGSLQATNAYVVDPARVSGTPAQPRSLLLLAAGLAFSLIGAVCTAVAMEAIDGTITSVGQIGTITGLPTLGFVPRYDSLNGANPSRFGAPRARPLLAANGTVVGANGSTDSSRKRLIVERDVMVGECFRAIRTAVLLAAKQNRRSQVIAVSSPLPGEGKTTTALNLSLVLAQQGSSVLLVDADLRKSTVHEAFGLSQDPGLTGVLGRVHQMKSSRPPKYCRILRCCPPAPHPLFPPKCWARSIWPLCWSTGVYVTTMSCSTPRRLPCLPMPWCWARVPTPSCWSLEPVSPRSMRCVMSAT